MQVTLSPLTPSLSLYKSRSSSLSSVPSFNPILNPSISPSSFPSCTPIVSSSFSSKFISLTPLHSSNNNIFHTKASVTAAPDSSSSSSLFKTLELGVLFCLWFSFNIYFNIYNKQVLKVYHLPVTITAFQFAIGTLLVSFMWGLNLYKRPKITSSQVLLFILIQSCYCFSFVLLLIYVSVLFCFLAAFSNISIGFGTYIRKPFHKHEPWKGCCFFYSYCQINGAFLFCLYVFYVPWRGKVTPNSYSIELMFTVLSYESISCQIFLSILKVQHTVENKWFIIALLDLRKCITQIVSFYSLYSWNSFCPCLCCHCSSQILVNEYFSLSFLTDAYSMGGCFPCAYCRWSGTGVCYGGLFQLVSLTPSRL